MTFQGFIENPMGYELRKIPNQHLYEFMLDPIAPLQFKLLNGRIITPNKHMYTDQASVPRILQWLPGLASDRYIAPLFHDSAYKDHGIFIDGIFTPLSRKDADDMLRDILASEGASVAKWTYWLGVRCFGNSPWKKGKVSI